MDHGGAGFAVQVPAGALDGSVAVPRRAEPLAGRRAWEGDEVADLAPPEFSYPRRCRSTSRAPAWPVSRGGPWQPGASGSQVRPRCRRLAGH
eukprot:2237456-Heterocapsa_arctica.AAC.1